MRVSASHPALPGHFPGYPVVPGVVMLDAVAGALAGHAGCAVRVTGFPAVKFLAVLAPGRDFEIVFTDRRSGTAAFEIRAGDARLASGTVSFEAARPAEPAG